MSPSVPQLVERKRASEDKEAFPGSEQRILRRLSFLSPLF